VGVIKEKGRTDRNEGGVKRRVKTTKEKGWVRNQLKRGTPRLKFYLGRGQSKKMGRDLVR